MKVKLHKRFSNRFKLFFGVEQFLGNFTEKVMDNDFGTFNTNYNNNSTATFIEANFFFNKKLAAQLGIRGTHNALLEYTKIAPRASLAYKIASKSQVSLAYGDFYQSPSQNVLKYNSTLVPEKSSHYILNYLYQNKGKTIRAEAYYKRYDDLIKYDTEIPESISNYSNNGNGYASGLDLFWRDNTSIKSFEYWLSYSYLNTQRDYKNFPESATPNFAAKHHLSLVGKYWINNWKSLISTTYNFASGRPYHNPNTDSFLQGKTKAYNSLNLSWAYLISQQKILYFSASNVLGIDNIFNYQYASSPNINGRFNRRSIRPAADRFFTVGFFWTISENKKDNQLDNL